MNKFDEYAQDKVDDFEKLKRGIKEFYKLNQTLSEENALEIMKRCFDLGHYVGHCRAEKYCKELYTGRVD